MILDPAFDSGTLSYTTATTNATNTITATASDGNATIVIMNDVTEVANGSSATWVTGENILTITVTNELEDTVYTITVTKS